MSGDLLLERDAVISDCGLYRYLLRRTWNPALPRALIIMLNPSTADANIDDATIRSCIRLTRIAGYGSFEVVNLFAFRSTDPDALAHCDDPVGPRNDCVISASVARCDLPICAWGAHPITAQRARKVWEAVSQARPAAFAFGTTKSGAPRHPLYVRNGTPLEVYRAP